MARIVNEAALAAARRRSSPVEQVDFEERGRARSGWQL